MPLAIPGRRATEDFFGMHEQAATAPFNDEFYGLLLNY
jgi:hypothetical protein